MRRIIASLGLGCCLLADPAAAHTVSHAAAVHAATQHHAPRKAALCAKPAELPLADNRAAITGNVAPDTAQCFAFTAPPGEHLTLTIDSPNNAAEFQLYQLKWYQLPAHHGAKRKWIEIVGAPDSDAGQTWSGALAGKGRHVLVVKTTGGETGFRLAVGIDPLHPVI